MVRDTNGKYVTKLNWQMKCGFSKGVKREAWIDEQPEPNKMSEIKPITEEVGSNDKDQPSQLEVTPTMPSLTAFIGYNESIDIHDDVSQYRHTKVR
jgi:hypothetical protein